MARAPIPTLLHLVQGTFDASRHGNARFQPIPEGTLGDPPEEWAANGVERKEWAYALAKCPVGMLRATDRRLLIAFCETCADYDLAKANVRKYGAVIKTPNGMLASSPFVTQRDKALRHIRMIGDVLGFSPSGRTRVQVEQPEQTVGDWAQLRQKTANGGGGEKPAE